MFLMFFYLQINVFNIYVINCDDFYCDVQSGESSEDGSTDPCSEARTAATSLHHVARGVDKTRPVWRRHRQRRRRWQVLNDSEAEHSRWITLITVCGRSKDSIWAQYLCANILLAIFLVNLSPGVISILKKFYFNSNSIFSQ